MRLLARLFGVFAIFFVLVSFFIAPARAQTMNPYTAPNVDSNVPVNMHTYMQSIVLEVLGAMACQLVGQDPILQNHQCLGINPSTGKLGYTQKNSGGAIGFVGNMISSLYTPPIDSGAYVHHIASNFGFVKHAYAAPATGVGFDKLSPLLGLWTTSRNLAYLVFVIIFVAIGFAIMLRVKIDPRTVMSIENQIPKILIGLILVTFSYAIAGFLIDMMYVSTYLTINVVTSSQGISKNSVDSIHNAERSDLIGGNPLGFANDVLGGGILGVSAGSAGSIGDLLRNMLAPDPIHKVGLAPESSVNCDGNSTFIVGFFGTAFCNLGNGVGNAVAGVIGYVISWVVSILALLIILIAIIIALIRLWFSLVLAYVSILLDVILAPFFIIAGVFPGSKVGFVTWLQDIGSNLLAFPVTVGMFLLAGIFMNNFAPNASNVFVPPLVGNPQGTGGGQSPIAYIIALGMILLTPSVVNIVRELLKAPKNQYLQSIASGLGAGATPLSEGVKAYFNYNQLDMRGDKQKWRGVIGGLFKF